MEMARREYSEYLIPTLQGRHPASGRPLFCCLSCRAGAHPPHSSGSIPPSTRDPFHAQEGSYPVKVPIPPTRPRSTGTPGKRPGNALKRWDARRIGVGVCIAAPLPATDQPSQVSLRSRAKTRKREERRQYTRCLIVGGMGTLRGIFLPSVPCGTWVAFRGGDGHLAAQIVDNPYAV
jgi:hypothetical protein